MGSTELTHPFAHQAVYKCAMCDLFMVDKFGDGFPCNWTSHAMCLHLAC